MRSVRGVYGMRTQSLSRRLDRTDNVWVGCEVPGVALFEQPPGCVDVASVFGQGLKR